MEPSFVTSQLGTATVFEVAGEIDLGCAPVLRSRLAELIADGCRSLIVDLTPVVLIDSTGLGVLIGARRRLVQAGGDLTIVVPDGPQRDLFAATGLDRIFDIVGTLTGAERS